MGKMVGKHIRTLLSTIEEFEQNIYKEIKKQTKVTIDHRGI